MTLRNVSATGPIACACLALVAAGIIGGQALHSQDRPALHRRSAAEWASVSNRTSIRSGFAFADTRFLVSLPGNGDVLYSLDLDGEYLGEFAPSIKIPGEKLSNQFEHPLGVSSGLGGFPCRDYYVGVGREIWHIANKGTAFDTFARGLEGHVKTLVFDTHGSFGYDLLVGTRTGAIYQIDTAGAVTQIAFIGESIRDMATVPPGQGLGPFDGELFVSSGSKGRLHAISPSGIDTILNTGQRLSYLEGIYIIPRDFGSSGRSKEGFYTYGWPGQVWKTDPHDLVSFRGDALLSTIDTKELLWRMHWNGSSFEFSAVAEFPDSPSWAHELVTSDRIGSGHSCSMSEDRSEGRPELTPALKLP